MEVESQSNPCTDIEEMRLSVRMREPIAVGSVIKRNEG